jgi:hypothetical protein
MPMLQHIRRAIISFCYLRQAISALPRASIHCWGHRRLRSKAQLHGRYGATRRLMGPPVKRARTSVLSQERASPSASIWLITRLAPNNSFSYRFAAGLTQVLGCV